MTRTRDRNPPHWGVGGPPGGVGLLRPRTAHTHYDGDTAAYRPGTPVGGWGVGSRGHSQRGTHGGRTANGGGCKQAAPCFGASPTRQARTRLPTRASGKWWGVWGGGHPSRGGGGGGWGGGGGGGGGGGARGGGGGVGGVCADGPRAPGATAGLAPPRIAAYRHGAERGWRVVARRASTAPTRERRWFTLAESAAPSGARLRQRGRRRPPDATLSRAERPPRPPRAQEAGGGGQGRELHGSDAHGGVNRGGQRWAVRGGGGAEPRCPPVLVTGPRRRGGGHRRPAAGGLEPAGPAGAAKRHQGTPGR